MPLAEDMQKIAEDIISSYDARIQGIESIFNTTHELLNGFQESFLDVKKERESANGELKEILARNESLRKKDFDNMMQGILSEQDEREKQVRDLLNSYLNEHKEIARFLSDSLRKFKESLSKGDSVRVKEFQETIKGILARQDGRKSEVSARMKEFQKEQKELAKILKELLAKGEELRIKDLKSMLREFRTRDKKRIAHQEERRKGVHDTLGHHKKERRQAIKKLRDMQTELANRRTATTKATRYTGKPGIRGK